MPTLAIRFPAGWYHATPWYRHVNEGAVEWPPSPWRLLRALLAVGFAKQNWEGAPDKIPGAARRLIEKLAQGKPWFLLPKGGVAHTRHYMPIVEGSVQKPTKVLDAFLRLGDPDEPLLVHWPVSLADDELALLGKLVSGLAYLGRAESWVDAALVADQVPDKDWSRPHVAGEPVPRGWEQTPVFTPVTPEAYAGWRAQALASALDAAGKLAAKKQAEIEAVYPKDLIACLCTDTAALQKAGWSQPPGAECVLYLRRTDALQPAVAKPRAGRTTRPTVKAALLTLASDTVHGQLCPLMTRALPHMERLHDAAAKKTGGGSPALTGCDAATREPLKGHQHAHWIPLDLDGDGRIEHVLVYAPMGLDADVQQALGRIERTWGKNLPEIIVSLAGFGNLDLIRKTLRDSRGRMPAEVAVAAVWESRTPFLAPRHLKPNGKNTVEGQVLAECESRKLPVPVRIERLSREETLRRDFLSFVRSRPGKPPPHTMPLGLRLTFAEPVSGPLSLGYGSHFGLGLFAAVK